MYRITIYQTLTRTIKLGKLLLEIKINITINREFYNYYNNI